MKRMTLEEVKQVELEALKYLKKVCKKNNLTYFLCGGTLLGAVRHQGFIPWDDDIDVALPRIDYMKLLKIIEDNGEYKILSPYNDNKYYFFFTKMVDKRTILIEKGSPKINKLGVNIDIYPLDGLPFKEPERFLNLIRREFINFFFSRRDLYYTSNTGLKRLLKIFLYFPKHIYLSKINWSKRKKNVLSLMEKYDFDKSKKVTFTLPRYGTKEIFDKEVFYKTVDVKFEGEYFSAPIGYDKYLSSLYCDYMKLPSEDKRKSHHYFRAYWKENGEKIK